jgi:hypothetical protein
MQILKKKYKIKHYKPPSNLGLKDYSRQTSPNQTFSLRNLSCHIPNPSKDFKLFRSKDQQSPIFKSKKTVLFTPLGRKSLQKMIFQEDFKNYRSSSSSLKVEGFNVGSFFAKSGFTGKRPKNEEQKFPQLIRQKSVPKRSFIETHSENETSSGYKELYIQHLLRKKIKNWN